MSTGLDPEVLVLDGSNRIVPASLFLEHEASTTSRRVAYDNAAVEIRPRHGGCLEGRTKRTKNRVREAIKMMRLARLRGEIPSGSHFTTIPAARLHDKHLNSPEHEELREFGCSPAYRITADGMMEEVEPLVEPTETNIRSAGFHVHQSTGRHTGIKSMDSPDTKEQKLLEAVVPRVKILDALIGLVDVLMLDKAGWAEQGQTRRAILGYGRAGEFRYHMQPGRRMEYRVLSPWPLSSPIWTWWAMSAVRSLIERTGNTAVEKVLPKLPDRSEIVEAIDQCNAEAAKHLWVESMTVWWDHGPELSSGNDSLAKNNIGRLAYALTHQGHQTFHPDWSFEWAWRMNTHDRQHVNRMNRNNSFSYRPGKWYPPKHRMNHFPSGVTHSMERGFAIGSDRLTRIWDTDFHKVAG